MLEDLKDRARKAVELAKAAGADDVFAKASRGRSTEVAWRDGKLEKVQESTSRGISIRLYVDGRYSAHSTTDLRPERLESFITEAVALTRALQQDPFREIPDPALFEGRSEVDLELVDDSIGELTQEQREAWCIEMDEAAHADDKVISASASVDDSHVIGADVSSNGFEGDYERTALWMGAEVTVQGEGDKRPEDWSWAGARHLKDIPKAIDIGTEALTRALTRLGTAKGPTRRGLMVVDPRAGVRLLSRLMGPANGRSVQQGQSFYAGKTGEKLVSEILSLTDDPLLVRGLASRFFDGEGIAAKPMPIIEAGVLKNLYIDTYYGKKLELPPTTGSSSNVIVGLGDKGLAELLTEAGDCVYVTSWLGGNSDSTTGDFSFGLRGHLVEGGVIGAPVGEMNVTGNLLDLFGHLIAVGNDPYAYSSRRVPTLVFEDVQFSGV